MLLGSFKYDDLLKATFFATYMYRYLPCRARTKGRGGPLSFSPLANPREFFLRPPKKAEPARQANCYLEDLARFDGQNSPNTDRRPQNAAEFFLRPCRPSPMSEEDWIKTR